MSLKPGIAVTLATEVWYGATEHEPDVKPVSQPRYIVVGGVVSHCRKKVDLLRAVILGTYLAVTYIRYRPGEAR